MIIILLKFSLSLHLDRIFILECCRTTWWFIHFCSVEKLFSEDHPKDLSTITKYHTNLTGFFSFTPNDRALRERKIGIEDPNGNYRIMNLEIFLNYETILIPFL